jgi:hypothetical protein
MHSIDLAPIMQTSINLEKMGLPSLRSRAGVKRQLSGLKPSHRLTQPIILNKHHIAMNNSAIWFQNMHNSDQLPRMLLFADCKN